MKMLSCFLYLFKGCFSTINSTVLQTKNTFVTVHGWGNIVFQSYPDYEEQRANLVVEIMFRAIRIVMKSKKMR